MNQIKFDNINEEKRQSLKKECIKIVKDNETCLNFILENNLIDEEVLSAIGKFLKIVNQEKVCVNCVNKKNCLLRSNGSIYSLSIDEDDRIIDLKLDLCSKAKKTDKYTSNYLYRQFDEEYLNYDINQVLSNEDYKDSRKETYVSAASILLSKTNKGIFLTGSRRCGKSFILAVFSKKYIDNFKKRVAFIDASATIKELNDLYFTNKDEFQKRLDELCEVDLLIIDDFGSEFKNEYTRDLIIYPLLNSRFIDNKLTCFTSNYSLNEIQQMYELREKNAPKARLLYEVINSLAKQVIIESIPYRE